MAERGRGTNAPGPGVAIGRLSLAVPGTNRGVGERVATSVTAKLAGRLPPGLSGEIGRLELTVHPRGSSDEALSEAVVEAVLRALPRRPR